MANLERTYNVPLRREFMKAPKYKRTMKAVKALREFLQRHMKCENVKIGRYANMELHSRGRRHPPHHIQVKAVKTTEKIKGKDMEIVKAELVGAPEEKPFLKESLGKETKKDEKKKEEIKGENIVAEKPFEKKEEVIEKKEKEEKKILEKEPKKKKVKEPTTKIIDKEQSIKKERQDIISKSEKPIHEGKR